MDYFFKASQITFKYFVVDLVVLRSYWDSKTAAYCV